MDEREDPRQDRRYAEDAPRGLAELMPERATQIDKIQIPKLQLPKGGGALRGIDEKFTVNASNGTASISVALPLTPNRDAFTPALDLSYSSGSGNGPFGLGWTLGLPAIQRKTDKRLPRYLSAPDEDIFMISGAEDLVPLLIEQNPGDWRTSDVTAGGYRVRAYRPRIAGDLSRIERVSHSAHGDYWKVIDRTNKVTIFGRSPAARIADPADPRRIYRWLPEFSFDDRGNWIAYEHKAEDPANMPGTAAEANRGSGIAPFANLYLKRIRYGNHAPSQRDPALPYDPPAPSDTTHHFEAVFDYGEHDALEPTPQEVPGQTWPYRADAFSSYRSGFEVRTARLCRRILMFHNFPDEPLGADTLVASLDLTYAPATVNGIGQADVVHLVQIERAGYVRRPDGSYARKAIPPLSFEYQSVVWDETIHAVGPEARVDAPVGIASPFRLVDLFGEGIAGILCEVGDDWIYKRNRGANASGEIAFERGRVVAPRPRVSGLDGGSITLEDLAASGEKQIVINGPQLGGYYPLRGDGGWDEFIPFRTATNVDLRDPTVRRIDLTGDGSLEIVVAEHQAFVWYASTGKDGFRAAERALQALDEERGPFVVFSEGEQTIFLADMSGDGLTDIVRIRNGEVVYWPNLGYGRFGAKVAMSAAPRFEDPVRFDPSRVRLADISGSGASDLIYLGSDGARAWLNEAGNGWSNAFALNSVPSLTPGTSFDVADLLGQGTACLVWSSINRDTAEAPFRYIDLMGGRKPHLLTRMLNNMGKETQLEYRSSTRFYLDDVAAGTPWVTRLPFPVQVVSRQILQEHVTGTRLVSDYTYHHGFWDPEEREFRGFGRVDRTDTEDYDTWALSAGGLTAAEARQAFQPPMLARTWYHLGAWFDETRILTQFASEYWQSAYSRTFPAAPAPSPEPSLPDARLVAAPTVLDPTIMTRLSADERREAVRACKSLVLRQEIFALDAPSVGASPADLQRQMTPYTVDTHNCHIQLLQPRGPNPYGVYLVAEAEGLHIDYERRASDRRARQGINLEIDALGNVLQKANINYGRDPVQAAAAADAIAATASDFASLDDAIQVRNALGDALNRTEAVQSRTRLTVTRSTFTNDVDLAIAWRTRQPAQVDTFEINGLSPIGTLFTLDALTGILDDSKSTAIPFETMPSGGVTRRAIERQRTLYYDEAAAAPLGLNAMASHGLVWQGQVCAFTASLLPALYGARIAAPAALLPQGGYVHSSGDADWWIPTGTVRYSNPGETIADVRSRFFKPLGHIDPFGAETLVHYYKDYFLLLELTIDAAGNRVKAERFDFRLLTPTLLRDANDALNASISDELALVKAQAYLGKDLDGDGVPETEPSDDLSGLSADTTNEAAAIAALLATDDSTVVEAQGRQLLSHTTIRFAYDLRAWMDRGEPAVAVTITRERHQSIDPHAPLHVIFEYTDGSGALAMTKAQAEPGVARSANVHADGSVTINDIDTSTQMPPRLRWIGSGRLVLNNKAKPVRRYEPYFSATPRYEALPELVATGVSAVLTYDPAGRLTRTDLPDGTIQRTIFDVWQTVTWDPGDTVLESRWHNDRKNRLIDAELIARGCDPAREAEAAVQAEAFATTPMTALLDPLGRPVLGLEHAGFDGGGKVLLFATTLVLDVAGNVLSAGDARGNTPIAFRYDMVGRRVAQRSMDAGERWTLPTVTNNVLMRWDERNHALTYQYDVMQRPTGLHVGGGDGPVPLDNQVMHAVYGEGQADDRKHGLRGRLFRRWDTGGMQEWSDYDGKGNLLVMVRRFASNYRTLVNWSGDLLGPLEAEAHTTTYSYDAVSRMIGTQFPDGSRTARRYTPANLLGGVDAQSPGGASEAIVSGIAYDARGRRSEVDHGNGARTTYRYDPETLRLAGLTTRKGDGSLGQDIIYTHDCGGNLTHLEDRALPTVFFDNTKIQALSHFGYDPLYRLVSGEGREHAGQQGANFGPEDNWSDNGFIVRLQPGDAMAWRTYAQSYRWDAVGNLRRLVHSAGAGGYTRAYAYDTASNRLTSTTVGANVYVYDHHPAHGFIRRMPHLPLMTFDFLDRMTATSRQSVAAGAPETTWYVYDHDGKRIRKVTDAAAAAGEAPARKEERLYLGALEIFRRHAGPTASLERTALHIMDDKRRFAMIDRRNGIDDGTPARVVRYQFSNHLGSSVLELDATGRALAYEEYHPFGTTAYQATDSTLQVATRRYRYCGMERDEESGLSLHGPRYYCPWLARWTRPDPVGLADGIDDYAYCSANPIRLADPGGCDGWDRFMGGLKMVGGALETVGGGAIFLGGCAASEIGVGIPVAAGGAVVTAHGLDVTVSGFRTMWNGAQVDTVTSQQLQERAHLTKAQANLADAGLSVVFSFGASLVTRAPAVASGVRGLGAAEEAASSSVTLAFKPGLPVGHNIVGVTTEGSTQWSHLVVDELAEASSGARYVPPGTGASVVASTQGPSAAYITVTVPRTAAQALAAQKVAQEAVALEQAGIYGYLTNNCTTYATSVLRASGVVAPPTTPAVSLVTTALQSPAVVRPIVAASVATNTAVGAYSALRSEAPADASAGAQIGPDPAAGPAPAAAPLVSTPDPDPAAPDPQVCSANGYYNDVEQVCYSR